MKLKVSAKGLVPGDRMLADGAVVDSVTYPSFGTVRVVTSDGVEMDMEASTVVEIDDGIDRFGRGPGR